MSDNEKCAVEGCEASGPCRVFTLGAPSADGESRGLCIPHFNEFNQLVMKAMKTGDRKWINEYLDFKKQEVAA